MNITKDVEIQIIEQYRKADKETQERVINILTKDTIEQYSLLEVQDRLGVSYKTALGYIQNGLLPAVRVGHKWKINKTDFDKFAYGK